MTLDERVQLEAIGDAELQAHGVGQVRPLLHSFSFQVLRDRHLGERFRLHPRDADGCRGKNIGSFGGKPHSGELHSQSLSQPTIKRTKAHQATVSRKKSEVVCHRIIAISPLQGAK